MVSAIFDQALVFFAIRFSDRLRPRHPLEQTRDKLDGAAVFCASSMMASTRVVGSVVLPSRQKSGVGAPQLDGLPGQGRASGFSFGDFHDLLG